MPYSLPQLQITSKTIAALCQHDDGKKISRSRTRILSQEILFELHKLSKKDPTYIVFTPSNGALKYFFTSLEEAKILFPDKTTFILSKRGISYKKLEVLKLSRLEQINIIINQFKKDLQNLDKKPLLNYVQQLIDCNLKNLLVDLAKSRFQFIKISPKMLFL